MALGQECSNEALLSCLAGAGETVSLLVAAAEAVSTFKPAELLRLSFMALVHDVASLPTIVTDNSRATACHVASLTAPTTEGQ